MDESKYHIEADKELQRLIEYFEGLEEMHAISAELESGVISVIMPDDKEYVINKHSPSQQIWVSSPYSGAGYYEFRDGEWQPKRAVSGKKLFDFIKEEITAHL